MDYAKCSLKSKDPIIVVSENRSRVEVINPGRLEISKIQVDGCLIDKKLEKCDWLIAVETPIKKAYYIELKGCDLDKAISQLKSTIEHTKVRFRDFKRECYAVTTRVPKHGSTIRKRCLDFYSDTGSTLAVKNIVIKILV
jgi:hypothetical protein